MSTIEAMQTPKWPAEPVDPSIARVSYDVVSDEFLVYFDGKPVPKVSSPLDAPGFEDVAVMIGLGPDDEETGEIVGVHVMSMLVGAVPDNPHWAVLAWAAMAGDHGAELLRERLPGFLDEVHDAFDRFWTPLPPIEEQLAAFAKAKAKRQHEETRPARRAGAN